MSNLSRSGLNSIVRWLRAESEHAKVEHPEEWSMDEPYTAAADAIENLVVQREHDRGELAVLKIIINSMLDITLMTDEQLTELKRACRVALGQGTMRDLSK